MFAEGQGDPIVTVVLHSVVTALPVPRTPAGLKTVRSGALSPFRFASCPAPVLHGTAVVTVAQEGSPVGPLLCGVKYSGDWSCHVGTSFQLPSRFLAIQLEEPLTKE